MSSENTFESDQTELADNDAAAGATVSAEPHTIADDAALGLAAKEVERRQIQKDIEAFLAAGGSIQSVDTSASGSPPKKPEPAYGSRPI